MSDDLVQETLKRTHDDTNGPATKRAHIHNPDDDDSVQVKVLIPSSAVGAIIGKGGETMRNLKNDSKCRVQMSRNQDTYPGTNERICLVKGKVSQVMMVVEALTEKIREKVEGSVRDPFDHKDVPRAQEVKLLMPNTSAGMVIGKAGASIKEIREGSGCQIQVFPKAGSVEAKNSLERVVTVAHEDTEKLMEAVQKVLEKVAADPMHAQYTEKEHDTFSSGGGTGANSFSSQAQPGFNSSKFNGSSSSASYQFNPMQNLGNTELLQFLDSLQSTLRSSGFNEAAVAEVMQAMQILAKYNIMGLGLGLGVAAMAQMRGGTEGGGFSQSNAFGGSNNTLDQSFNTSHGGQAGGQCWGYSASQMGQQQNTTLARLSNVEAGGHAATVMNKIDGREENQLDIEVPDSCVGAILGTRARTLIDIQQQSGAKITVHKRGEEPFPLHDGLRLISLTGDPEQRRAGRLLIERVINDNFNRRQVS
ncbi:unnamed protein product, partial [Mesorhabditis spiculigera]